jgi:RNA polymerase sigma factor (sigma-70 family)
VQECLLQISRRWTRVSTMEQQAGYARRVLVNLVLRGSKKRSRQRAELDAYPIEGATAADAAELLELRDELMICLRQLTPRQRTVLALRYFYDLPESQVADALGCSIGTVRSTTSRSLAQLRDAIQTTTTNHEV